MSNGNGNDGSRTERWVKWGISLALLLIGAAFTFVLNQQERLSNNETEIALLKKGQEIYSRERMDLDRSTQATLEKMATQNENILHLLGAIAGDETYQREVQRERQRYYSNRTPVFGQK